MNVIVLGAGIVGACTAIELLKSGARVTLIDAGTPGAEQAASHGNGAWLSPASIVPMSTPGLWRKVPGYLMDKSGPLTIRLSSLPGLAPGCGALPAPARPCPKWSRPPDRSTGYCATPPTGMRRWPAKRASHT
ncbi:FAD-dependent oxidoreductase [Pseudomonas shirazica]|nr:FAD-dependent oxidoreductase [Pseudomonas shirazica]